MMSALIRFVPLLVAIAAVTAIAQESRSETNALWVTLANGPRSYEVAVQTKAGQDYVREFVAGRAPVAIPAPLLEAWMRSIGLPLSSAVHPRITRAMQCREDGSRCVRLPGLYAGRSPAGRTL